MGFQSHRFESGNAPQSGAIPSVSLAPETQSFTTVPSVRNQASR